MHLANETCNLVNVKQIYLKYQSYEAWTSSHKPIINTITVVKTVNIAI